MANRALLHKVLLDTALDSFTTMTVHRSQKFQNTTKSISAQCGVGWPKHIAGAILCDDDITDDFIIKDFGKILGGG